MYSDIYYLLRFFFKTIDKIIATNIIDIIAITPGQPNIETILLPRDIMTPASITPRDTAKILVLKSRSNNEAARVPVQAPVPGSGIPTNNNKQINHIN